MIRTRAMFLLVCMAGAPAFAEDEQVPADWTGRVQLQLSPAQETFVQYEPVSLRVHEVNRGARLPALPMMGHTAQVYVKYEGQSERVIRMGATEGDAFNTRIPPWTSGLSRDWLLMLIHADGAGVGKAPTDALERKFLAAKPGVLVFRYELSLDGKQKVSAEATVKVRPLSAEDQALLSYIGDPSNLLFLYEGSTPPAGTSRTDFLEEICSRFPGSSFAPYAFLKLALVRGTDWAYPERKEWTDYEAAYRAANEVVRRFPDSAVAPQAAYYVAHMLTRLGRDKELAERVDELRGIVGEDLQHSICLKMTLEGKDFGCEGPIQ